MNDNNIELLLAALHDFGFGSLNLKNTDFKDPENVIQLGYEPNRIDLLMDVDGLNFQECFTRRSAKKLGDLEVNFIGINDLLKAKSIAGRPKDLADADELRKIRAIEEE